MEYFGLAASFIMGVVLGLVGGGGSILTVPILVYLFALTPVTAAGYSLFIVGITALAGSSVYIRKGEVDFLVGLSFAVPSVVGVNLSRALLVSRLPEIIVEGDKISLTRDVLLMLIFAGLMVAASYSMIIKKKEAKPMQAHPVLRLGFIAIQGIAVGMIAGFVGAGGGFLIIPVLIFIAGLSMRVAVGTSLLIIAFQSLLGFAGDVIRGLPVDWGIVLKVAVFAVIGIIIGSQTAHKINEQKLKRAFGWFVLIMGLGILAEQFGHI